jgi:protein-disulfide isomerase
LVEEEEDMSQAAEFRLTSPVSARDHIRGAPEAPITLVEYGDYECPYCRALTTVVDGLVDRLGDQLRFVFRHFPLTPAHPHAFRAAEAAEAAAAQGRYWEMHDLLFTPQQTLEDEDLAAAATSLGLDVDRFTHELRGGVHAERVREDIRSGLDSGVAGTPTLYLDGVRYETTVSLPDLLAAIGKTHPGITVAPGDVPESDRRRIPRVRPRQPTRP